MQELMLQKQKQLCMTACREAPRSCTHTQLALLSSATRVPSSKLCTTTRAAARFLDGLVDLCWAAACLLPVQRASLRLRLTDGVTHAAGVMHVHMHRSRDLMRSTELLYKHVGGGWGVRAAQ